MYFLEKCRHQRNSRGVSRDLFIFWIFLSNVQLFLVFYLKDMFDRCQRVAFLPTRHPRGAPILNRVKSFMCRQLIGFLSKTSRSCLRRYSVRKGVLRNFAKFTEKHLWQSLFLNKIGGLRPATLLKETPTHVFYCKFCKISKNTFFTGHLQTTAPELFLSLMYLQYAS